ncbi:hypothetical protein [Nonlabens agnitus]|nr:hypothetical protein [Nonlabens agnitus]
METMVATVLIVVIFILASLILNNLFSNSIKRDTVLVDARLTELEYSYLHKKINLPYSETLDDWNIEIISREENELKVVLFQGSNVDTGQSTTKKRYETNL